MAGKTKDNCHIERFNGPFRGESLNLRWFETLEEVNVIIKDWATGLQRELISLDSQQPVASRISTRMAFQVLSRFNQRRNPALGMVWKPKRINTADD